MAPRGLTPKTWAPVSYSAQVTGLSAGETIPFPQVTLQSGFNTPYLIDEIRLMASMGVTGLSTVIPAAFISFQLSAGRHQFSSGAPNQTPYVPMCLFGPTYSSTGAKEDVSVPINTGTLVQRRYSTRRWVLPKPLFMEAGDTIHASVSRDASYGSSLGDISAWVTVIGRALPPGTPHPAKRCIPYVSYFIHPVANQYSEATNQVLRNTNAVPWTVQRLILVSRSGGASTVALGTGMYENSSPSNYATVRIGDSLGYKVTGSSAGGFVPLSDVATFYNNVAWTFSRTLPPQAYYNVAFNLVRGAGTPTGFQPMISFVGYREEVA